MTLKRLSEFGLSLLLSLSSLLVIAVPKAYAAPITWNGGSDGNFNFSDGENWVGGVAPTDGDILIFRSGVTFNDPVNDMPSTVFGGIEFGAIGGFECPHTGTVYDFSGSAIQLSGNITWQNDSCAVANFDAGIVLTANVMVDTNAGTESASFGDISLGANTLTIDTNTAFVTLDGIITGTGGLTKEGAGYVSLGADNTFSGPVVINNGSVTKDTDGTLGTAAGSTTVNDGARLTLCVNNGSVLNEPLVLIGASGNLSVAKLSVHECGKGGGGGGSDEVYGLAKPSDSTATLSGSLNLGSNITFTSGITSTTITGQISGSYVISLLNSSGNLVIDSASNGSQTANGTYKTDPVAITLSDNLPTSSVTINNSATVTITGTRGDIYVNGVLKGNGTVGNIYVNNDGKLAPGMSPGCINSSNLTVNGTYEVEIGGTAECSEYDRTNVTGTVDVSNGTLSVLKFNNFTPGAGQTYQIIANDSNDAVTGTFQNLAEGATVTFDGVVYRVSYVGGDGNDVVLTVVSVPTTPDTGFQMFTNNPLATLAGTMLAAGAILMIAKRYNRVSVKR